MRLYLLIYFFSGLGFFILPSLLPLRFLENDDTVMMMLASGLYGGIPSANLVFINYYIGLVLSALYSLRPEVGWYEYMMLMVLATVFATLICIAVSRCQQGKPVGFAVLAVLICLLASSVAHINFTTVAAFATAVGAWVLLTQCSVPARLVGLMLCVMGGLLRFEAAGLVLLLSAPFFALALHQGSLRPRSILIFATAVLAMVVLEMSGKRAYTSIDADYVAYNEIRGQINDNPNLDLIRDRLPSGLSTDDFFLIRNFFFDSSYMTLEQLAEMRALLDEEEVELSLQHWQQEFLGILKNPYIAVLILSFFGATLTRRDAKVAIYFGAGILLMLAVLTYVDVHATLKPRVVRSAVIALGVSLFFLPSPRALPLVARYAEAVPLCILAAAFSFSTAKRLSVTLAGQNVYQQQVALIEQWDGSVYIFRDDFYMQYARLFDVRLKEIGGALRLLGWGTKHPDNPATNFSAFVDENVAVFILPREDRAEAIKRSILSALQRHHGAAATVHEVSRNEHGVLLVFR